MRMRMKGEPRMPLPNLKPAHKRKCRQKDISTRSEVPHASYFEWFKYRLWRFVFVQQVVGKELLTFRDFPPMRRGASFNLDAVKAEMGRRMVDRGQG